MTLIVKSETGLIFFDKYRLDFGRSKPPCESVAIPTAWNYGKDRKKIYYVKFFLYERWFNCEDDLEEYLTFHNKLPIIATDVYEIEI